MRLNKAAFIILSFTWGLPLTLWGCIMAIVMLIRGEESKRCGWACGFITGRNWGGIEGGYFFVCDNSKDNYIAEHEFGHAIQNCILGPFMIPLVTLPSVIRYWYRRIQQKRGIDMKKEYDEIWFERQATDLGRIYSEQIARTEYEQEQREKMFDMQTERKEFDLQEYITKGVEQVVSDAVKATLRNPKESAFMAKFVLAVKAASKRRRTAEDKGEHIPTFLIASITSKCNLHCAGCYSRCNNATVDEEPVSQLTTEEWVKIFDEADDLGISFILLAGGEPMLRRDVIKAAGEKTGIMFPIFTNGTYMDEQYMELFDRCRNLVPIMSIEGDRNITDLRRGAGVYDRLIENMDELRSRGLIFGAAVTVTTQNICEVTSDAFLKKLSDRGCKAVIFVEYVPVTEDSAVLAPGDKEREYMTSELERLRRDHPEMVFVSFPGDEKGSGGCVAAGRGFFHINSHGGAEPCPFSPYSDVNVRDTSLKDALNSRLFRKLRDGGYLLDDHTGGCTLFVKKDQVESILQNADGNN